jgi:hypothetical protein
MTTKWGKLKLNCVSVRRVRGRLGREVQGEGGGMAWADRVRSAASTTTTRQAKHQLYAATSRVYAGVKNRLNS